MYGAQAAIDWLFTALRGRQLGDSQLRQIAGHALPGDLLVRTRRQLLSDLKSLDENLEAMEADKTLRGRSGSR